MLNVNTKYTVGKAEGQEDPSVASWWSFKNNFKDFEEKTEDEQQRHF